MGLMNLNGYLRDSQGLLHAETVVFDPEDQTYTTRMGLEWVGRDVDDAGAPAITQLMGWAFADAYTIRFGSGRTYLVDAKHRGQKRAVAVH